MVVTRKPSEHNAPPVPSRTNTSQNRPPQLKDTVNSMDVLDPFARSDPRSIPVAFQDDVKYASKAAAKAATSPLARPATPDRAASQPPAVASPSKSKKKKKQNQKSGLPSQLVKANPRSSLTKRKSRRWYLEYWVIAFFAVYILAVCPTDSSLDHSVCRAINTYKSYLPTDYVRYQFDNALQHPYIQPVVQTTAPYYNRAVAASKPVVKGVKYGWKKTAAPALSRAATRAERWATPYAIAAADAWHYRTDAHVHYVQKTLKPYRRHAEKFTVIALQRTYTTWRKSQPYLRTAWSTTQTFVVRSIINPAWDAWQTWGDSRIRQLWARIEDFVATNKDASSSKPKHTPFGAFAQAVRAAQGNADSEYDLDDDVPEDDLSSSVTSSMVTSSATSTSVVSSSATSSVATSSVAPSSATTPAAASSASIAGASQSKPPPPSATDPVQAFLNKLLAEDYRAPGQTDEPPPPPVQTHYKPTPEQVKAKRDEIWTTYDAYAKEVDEKLATVEDNYLQDLVVERDALTKALVKKDGRVSMDLSDLESDLTLALQSANLYLEQLAASNEAADPIEMWERLVERVEETSNYRIQQSEAFIDKLWKQAQQIEEGIIERHYVPIYEIAEVAESKIALPLSWLDDVSPADWTKLHSLKKKVKASREVLAKIQDGSHQRSPADPVVAFFKRTQQDVQDMLAGFDVQFLELRRKAAETFAGDDGQQDEDYVPFIGRGAEEIMQALGRHEEL